MYKQQVSSIHGIVNINKSPGATSMDMVRMVKRLTQLRHVGHGGTLDPVASGVLPICIGQATRAMEYLIQNKKSYWCRLRLGITTDTYDSLGVVTSEGDASQVTREQVEQLTAQFTGLIAQLPPMYSALKHKGKRLYELAREGVEVEREARQVNVYQLEIHNWAPPFVEIEVECGRGLYMRSLAHDIGQVLGCGAHLESLIRQRTGALRIEDSITPEEFQSAVEEGDWQKLVQPTDVVLIHLDSVEVDSRAERALRNGQPASLPPRTHYASHLERCRAYSADGRFIGVVRFNKARREWEPDKIFRLVASSPLAPGKVNQS